MRMNEMIMILRYLFLRFAILQCFNNVRILFVCLVVYRYLLCSTRPVVHRLFHVGARERDDTNTYIYTT